MVQLTQGLLGISLPKDEFNIVKSFESFGFLFLKSVNVFLAQKANFLQNNRLLPKFYRKCFIIPNGFNSFFLKDAFFSLHDASKNIISIKCCLKTEKLSCCKFLAEFLKNWEFEWIDE